MAKIVIEIEDLPDGNIRYAYRGGIPSLKATVRLHN